MNEHQAQTLLLRMEQLAAEVAYLTQAVLRIAEVLENRS